MRKLSCLVIYKGGNGLGEELTEPSKTAKGGLFIVIALLIPCSQHIRYFYIQSRHRTNKHPTSITRIIVWGLPSLLSQLPSEPLLNQTLPNQTQTNLAKEQVCASCAINCHICDDKGSRRMVAFRVIVVTHILQRKSLHQYNDTSHNKNTAQRYLPARELVRFSAGIKGTLNRKKSQRLTNRDSHRSQKDGPSLG